MRKIKQTICVFVLVAVLSSCATIFSTTKQQVTFNSEPSGAMVKTAKDEVVCPATPCAVKVKRSSKSTFIFEKAGFENNYATIKGSFNPTVLLNILLGGLIGLAVDYGTGAAWTYNYPTVYTHLTPKNEYKHPSNEIQIIKLSEIDLEE
ncbi:MAG: hypothetical protein LBH91_01700 [Prevotellaceae bacterium]|nr:hypothetical protein [Prevotellaceae bacterium]